MIYSVVIYVPTAKRENVFWVAAESVGQATVIAESEANRAKLRPFWGEYVIRSVSYMNDAEIIRRFNSYSC